jgi:hypothetical protein
MAEKQFIDGMSVKEGGVPSMPWLKAKFGVSKKFIEFFNANVDERGWINFDMKESKNGTLYLELNTYKKAQTQSNPKEETENIESIPF